MEISDIKIPFIVLVTWFLRLAVAVPMGLLIIGAIKPNTEIVQGERFYDVFTFIGTISDQYWQILVVIAMFAFGLSIFLYYAKSMRWVNADSFDGGSGGGDAFKKW